MIKLVTQLLNLLTALLELIGGAVASHKNKKHQEAADHAQEDPAEFFDSHFNGADSDRVRPLPNIPAEPAPDKTPAGKP